jgi:hypothetical protein
VLVLQAISVLLGNHTAIIDCRLSKMAAFSDKILKCFISMFSCVLVQIGFQAQWEILGSIGEAKYCLLDLGK